MMKATDLFIKSLQAEGVRYIFAVPGEENIDMLESIRKSDIQLIVTRHEQGAGFMAATYGRLTGHVGVCLSTLGPGATNLVTPAAYAQLGGMPMMMITGQKPVKSSKQARFQIIDTVGLMRPITKFTRQISHGNNIPSNIREAFRLAVEERPGTVHLELPEDIARDEVDDIVFKPQEYRRPIADHEAIKTAAFMIQQAKFPLLLIGAGANRKITCKALTAFVNHTGIPFFNTQMGKGVVDERHSKYLGTAALSDHDFLHEAIRKSDLIINVGHDIIEKPPFFMHHNGQIVIHVNFFPAEVDPVYFPQHNVVGDIANSIDQLREAIVPQKWDVTVFENIKQEVESRISKYFLDTRFPMLPQRLVSHLRKSLGDEDIISLDNGIYKIWFARNYKCYAPNTLLLDNALASMGAGLPAAMAAKLIYPEKKVVAVCGDGGFMMNSQEIETAIRLQLDLVVIILNDGAYGMIKWKQEDMGFENFGLEYNNPDFVKYAESYGATGYRPESDDDFSQILNDALNNKGVHIIDLPVDYSLNHAILNLLLKNKKQ